MYPGPMNGDRAQFEIEHADTPLKERPDWPLPSFDCRDWAEAFCKNATELGYRDADGNQIDLGWAQAWFGNALMHGYDEGMSKALAEDGDISRLRGALQHAADEIESLRGALKPFSDAVYNDNFDMTVNYNSVGHDDYIRAWHRYHPWNES